jgi:predicted amidohydrolase
MPTHAERIVWAPGDGSTLGVVDTPIGRLGGLICWEHWMPLARFAMHAQGEQIHVAAWPEGTYVTEMASLSYAFEGRCFVIAASPYMTRADLPCGFELEDVLGEAFGLGDDDIINPGGSGVAGPDGRWLVGPVYGHATIVLAELDLARIAEEQQVFDAAGHYNRPDVFHLSVDTRANSPVRWRADRPEDAQEATYPGLSTDQPPTQMAAQ